MWCVCHHHCEVGRMARASVFNSFSWRSSRDSAAGLRGLRWRERCSTSQLIMPTELTHTPHRELRSGDTGEDAARRTNEIAAVAARELSVAFDSGNRQAEIWLSWTDVDGHGMSPHGIERTGGFGCEIEP